MPLARTSLGALVLALSLSAAAGGASADDASAKATAPDLRALRHFARAGEAARVRAETVRLNALHPSWTPPEDLLRDEGSTIQALWDLAAQDKIAEVRARLAGLRAEPGFVLPKDLLQHLDGKEARAQALNARDARQWRTVLRAAETLGPSLSGDLELVWTVAEALAGLGHIAEAEASFALAWQASDGHATRLGTTYRALDALGPTAVLSLLERPDLQVSPAFRAEVEDIIARRALATVDDAPGETADPGITPIVQRFTARVEARAERGEASVMDAAALGWSHLNAGRPDVAAEWFARAIPADIMPAERDTATLKAVEGRILALSRSGSPDAARKLAEAHRGGSTEIDALALAFLLEDVATADPASLSMDRAATIANRIAEAESPAGAEALGWLAYRRKAHAPAVAWFRKAMEWDTASWDHAPKAALGLALGLRDLGETDERRAVQTAHVTRIPEIAEIDKRILSAGRLSPQARLRQQLAVALKAKRMAECLALSARLGMQTAKDAELRGWCLMDAARMAEAAEAFRTALALPGADRPAAARGLVWAHLRSGATRAAAQAVATLPLDDASRREAETEIWTQRARAAFDRRAYGDAIAALDARTELQPEPRGLRLMRGWALHHLGRRREAVSVFETLDRQLSTPESRRALVHARLR
ncbi:MAG: hypothetical protein AAF321_01500 [Pseudomonadota bacterium]